MHYLPYRGKYLEVGDATLADARQVEIDGRYWSKTRKGWEEVEAADFERGRFTVMLASESVLRISDDAEPVSKDDRYDDDPTGKPRQATPLDQLLDENEAEEIEKLQQQALEEADVDLSSGEEARIRDAKNAAAQDATGIRPVPQHETFEEEDLEEEEIENGDK